MFTIQDAIEHLMLVTDAMPVENQVARLKLAVINGARHLSTAKQWRCLKIRESLYCPPPFSTGTVSYDPDTRQAVFSDALPDFAQDANLIFLGQLGHWPVEEQSNATTVRLRFGPKTAITDSAFVLYKAEHVLPRYVTAIEGVVRLDALSVYAVTFDEYMERLLRFPGQLLNYMIYTVAGSQRYLGRTSLYTGAASLSSTNLEYLGSRMFLGDDLVADGWAGRYRAGAVSVSGVTVTGSETKFSQDMVGYVIRFSGNNEQPPTGSHGANPPVAERVIVRVDDTAHLLLDSPVAGLSGTVRYTISAPIDLPEYALEAFLRACELQYFIAYQPERVRVAYDVYVEALRRAKAADVAYPFADTERIIPVAGVIHVPSN